MRQLLFTKHLLKPLALVALFLFLVHIVMKYVYLADNPTHSEPVGQYILFPAPLQKNHLYQICLDRADKRQYLELMGKLGLAPSSICGNGFVPLLKTIVAISGDEVRITESGILVDNKLLPNSKTETTYNSLNLLPLKTGYTHVLLHDEYWLYGGNDHSYDSRYFGIVKSNEIGNRAVLIFGGSNG